VQNLDRPERLSGAANINCRHVLPRALPAFFAAAGFIGRILGKTGITVLTRLFGMLLAALSVQFVLDGLNAFGFGPTTG